ncbi:MAG TPA: type II secretion system F family protein [Actinopolymorphaceae bacterium]|jgi:tight adherence protein B
MSVGALICVVLAAAAAGVATPDRPATRLLRRLKGRLPASAHDAGGPGMTRALTLVAQRCLSKVAGFVTRARADLRPWIREACEVMVAELQAGHDTTRVLDAAAQVFPALAPVAAVSRMGGNVPAAIRSVDVPGAEDALESLAAAWTVGVGGGTGLAVVLDRVVADMRAEESLRDEVAAQLAGPRASARMLALLPLAGVALGMGTEADPLSFLFGSPYGWACMLVGLGLTMTGLRWVERLARRAERLS